MTSTAERDAKLRTLFSAPVIVAVHLLFARQLLEGAKATRDRAWR